MVATSRRAPAAAPRLLPAVVAVAPLVVLFVPTVIVVAGWAVGASPFWPVVPVTLSEAAAIRDQGEVVRLIEIEGVDPNRAWPVRAGMLGDAVTTTPLEAATAIGRAEMFRLLLRHGARPPSGPARVALICRAAATDAAEVLELLLKTGDGSDPRGQCPPPRH